MTSAPAMKQPWNDLHHAAKAGSLQRTVALLSKGSIDVDQQGPQGATPLMLSSYEGHSRIVRILLNSGANVSLVEGGGVTALHLSAQRGHLEVCNMLFEAGADLEARGSLNADTPLHLAAFHGHSKVVTALIEAGASPNSRRVDGSTPLYMAATKGHKDAIKVLLRAKADPLLNKIALGRIGIPLVAAAKLGHLEVVRCMIQEVGIERCGGASGGVHALCQAGGVAKRVDIMALLTDAGVVDTGQCLHFAVGYGIETSVKFLLQQLEGWNSSDAVAYVNNMWDKRTPLSCAIALYGDMPSSSRIVRLLVDAGANTASVVQLRDDEGRVVLSGTPLALVTRMLHDKKIGGKGATQEQMRGLEGVRRLLLREEAIHAVSLHWPGEPFSIHQAAEGIANTKTISTPVTLMLPILRRRAARPKVLSAALFRYSGKR